MSISKKVNVFGRYLKKYLQECPQAKDCVLAETLEKKHDQILKCTKHVREIAEHLVNSYYKSESDFRLVGAYLFIEIGVCVPCGTFMCSQATDRHAFNLDSRLKERFEVSGSDFPPRSEYAADECEKKMSIAAAVRMGYKLKKTLEDTSVYFDRLSDLTMESADDFKRNGIYVFAEKGFRADSGMKGEIIPERFFMGDAEHLSKRFKIDAVSGADVI